MNNQPERIIGKYPITKQLARNSQHATFISKSPTADTDSVIKIYSNKLAVSQQFKTQFIGEMRQLKTLNHPNIIPTIDYGFLDDKFPFIEMPYVGLNLDACIQLGTHHTNIKNSTTLIFQAMIYAHHQGCVHGNLKPSNILFDNGHQPYIGDFRLTCVDKHIPYPLSLYSAPEQANAHRTDEKSDIYSLGLVLFTWFTGQEPIWSEVFPFNEHRILPPISMYYPSASHVFDDVIQRATAPNSSDRYNTINEFFHEYLKAWRGVTNPQLATRIHPLAVITPSQEPAIDYSKLEKHSKNKSFPLSILIYIAIFAFIMAGSFLFLQNDFSASDNPNNDYVYSPATIPDGYSLVSAENIEIAVPIGWESNNSREQRELLSQNMPLLSDKIPSEAYDGLVQGQDAFLSQNSAIFMRDAYYGSTLNIEIRNMPYQSPNEVIQLFRNELESIGWIADETAVLQFPVGEVAYVRISLAYELQSFSMHMYFYQYKNKLYMIGIGGVDPYQTEISGVMMNSFRVKP